MEFLLSAREIQLVMQKGHNFIRSVDYKEIKHTSIIIIIYTYPLIFIIFMSLLKKMCAL